LHVTPATGAPFKFEHHGPNLRIGRDPESELTLEGDASQSVSWNHARVEISSAGAYLTDLKSTNGTFVNDKRIHERVPLHQGDVVQLGHTGPKLRVTELDVDGGRERHSPQAAGQQRRGGVAVASPPAAAGTTTVITKSLAATRGMLDAVQRTQRNMLIGMSVVGIAILAIVFVMLWRLSRPPIVQVVQDKNGDSKPAAVQSVDQKAASATSAEKSTNGKSDDEKTKVVASNTAATQQQPKEEKKPASAPPAEPKPIGSYIAPQKGPPSILLQRQHETEPWARLRDNDRTYTENYLVSLPGYRSKIYLNSGVHLTLWGSLPEFSKFPPVYDTVVVLHEAAPGIDLDFTLERGRVLLANYKQPMGEAHIRVHFRHQTWDLTIPDNKSEVVLELWGLYPRDVPFSKDPGGKGPLAALGLFVKGQALLKIGSQEYRLGDLSQFVWSNANPNPMGPQTLPKLPDWWTDKVAHTRDADDMMLGLIDLSQSLTKNTSVVDAVLTETKEAKDIGNRKLGVWFLAAMDAIPDVVAALEDRQYPEVRGTAAYVLRNWISHSADHDMELYRTLQDKKGFSKEKAEIVMRLLHDLSDAEVADPKTYETLIGYLDHDNLAIRELALWHLVRLVPPDLIKTIMYDPTSDKEKRKAGIDQWKKLLADGKLPPKRPQAPPGR